MHNAHLFHYIIFIRNANISLLLASNLREEKNRTIQMRKRVKPHVRDIWSYLFSLQAKLKHILFICRAIFARCFAWSDANRKWRKMRKFRDIAQRLYGNGQGFDASCDIFLALQPEWHGIFVPTLNVVKNVLSFEKQIEISAFGERLAVSRGVIAVCVSLLFQRSFIFGICGFVAFAPLDGIA